MTSTKTIERARKRRDKAYDAANKNLAAAIQEARKRGATWPAIAKAMGMTRMGVHNFMKRQDVPTD